MDHLWQEVQPFGLGGNTDAGFDMNIVTPIDSGHPTPEQLQQHQQLLQQGKLAKGASVFVGKYIFRMHLMSFIDGMLPADKAPETFFFYQSLIHLLSFPPTRTGVQIPPLLSTMIAADEAASVYTADHQFDLHSPAEQAELEAHIGAHNQSLSGIVDSFNLQMEQWRTEKDAKVKTKAAL